MHRKGNGFPWKRRDLKSMQKISCGTGKRTQVFYTVLIYVPLWAHCTTGVGPNLVYALVSSCNSSLMWPWGLFAYLLIIAAPCPPFSFSCLFCISMWPLCLLKALLWERRITYSRALTRAWGMTNNAALIFFKNISIGCLQGSVCHARELEHTFTD